MLLQLCPTLCDPVNCSPPGVLSMGFSRQEYWSGLPCPPPDLPNSGVKPAFLTSPALAGRFFTTSTTWEALKNVIDIVKLPSGCWANLYFCHQHELLPNGSCRRENIKVWSLLIVCERLPWWLSGTESSCHCRCGLIPRLGKSSGEGNGYPLQYACLENPMDRGAWQAAVHGGQSQTWLSDSTINSREVYSTPKSLHFYVISLSLIWDFVLCLQSFHFHVFSCFFLLLLGTFILKKKPQSCRQAHWTPTYVTSKHYLNETALPPSWNHWLLTSCSCGWCLWTYNWPVYFQATKVRSLHWVNPPPGCLAFCALDFIIREASAHGLA